MKRVISLLASCVFVCVQLGAQKSSDLIKFNDTVHDFGQVLLSDGPVSCVFEGTNVSTSDVTVMSVTTSCGCTNVKWNHDPVAPGAKLSISATYSNDEGAYPFDKTITVKLAGQAKPILLHMRGISQKAILPDSQVYTNVFGGVVALGQSEFKCGNLEMGESRGEQFTMVNLSSKAVRVSFSSVSKGMSLEVNPNPIPAGAHATVYYRISSLPDVWGYNNYSANVVVDGKDSGKSFTVKAFTSERFTSMTREQKQAGSRPVFEESTFSFGHKKQGSRLTATFVCENKGKSEFKVYKADTDFEGAVPSAFPMIPAGGSGKFTVSLDTAGMPKGEALVMVTLTTNSPLRPIVTLFLAGIID